jgi:hypothetical protein
MTKYTTQENKSILLSELENNIINITFNKLSGETRSTKCTLQKDILPKASKDDHFSQKKIRKISPEVLTVWDVDKNRWRSIRWVNIVKVENVKQTERTNTGST